MIHWAKDRTGIESMDAIRTHMFRILCVTTIVLWLGTACSDSSTAGAVLPDADTTGQTLDVINGEIDNPDGTTSTPDVDPNDASEIWGGEDGGTTVDEDFGDACDFNSQCESGYCVPTAAGKVCTSICLQDCPPGWNCEAISQTGSDTAFVCVPTETQLCEGCLADSDCKAGVDTRCHELPGEGLFCTRSCDVDAPCPAGYACKPGENNENFCFPTDGSCLCFGDQFGASEQCYLENVFGVCYGKRECPGPGGWTDCDAKVPSVEICDGFDNDCDGHIDDETDGAPCEKSNEHGLCTGKQVCNGINGLYCSAAEPGPEVCGDMIDNDCNMLTDEANAEGCTVYFEDIDNDGFGATDSSQCLCGPTNHFTALIGGDCNDLKSDVNPDATETCNGFDDNCDDVIDPQDSQKCVVYFLDDDSDGYGDKNNSACFCNPTGKYVTKTAGDCNDGNLLVYPGATEHCNGEDDNCNTVVDEANAEGCTPFLRDSDDDGYGVAGLFQCLCAPKGDFDALQDGDCDDTNPSLNPGVEDICDNIDNNCNGIKDDNCDQDNDGFCTENKPVIGNPSSCPFGAGDCNDFDPNINGNQVEVCDNKDNNCNESIDEGVQSPCGGCSPVCLMNAGPGGEAFGGANSALSNTQLNGNGQLQINAGNEGTYRHVFEGWESGQTQWMQAGLSLEQTDFTWADLRVRSAQKIEDFSNNVAAWTPWFGAFPPVSLPVNLGANNKILGRYLEIEVRLSKSQGSSPVLKGIDIVAAEFK